MNKAFSVALTVAVLIPPTLISEQASKANLYAPTPSKSLDKALVTASSQIQTPGSTSTPSQSLLDPQMVQDLQKFQSLQVKSLPSLEEENIKKELLRNSFFLKGAGFILQNTKFMSDPSYLQAENAALDLLIEALRSGDRKVAFQVIQKVIQDPQIEDPQISLETRKTLAGIKAELLFHSTALYPSQFQGLEASLPGPVSQKIWQNVQEQQNENLAESRREIASREAQKSH